jgi:hypothetical protein
LDDYEEISIQNFILSAIDRLLSSIEENVVLVIVKESIE